ncbi:MAG: SpoIIE family protein phosphatase [Phycisphaerales bacterium]|nr:SpoIIE family protein phosphatase [Phycisphaerales bacterium]
MRFRTLLTLAVSLPLFFACTAVTIASYFNARHRSAELGERLVSNATAHAARYTAMESRHAVSLIRGIAGLVGHGLEIDNSDVLVDQLLGMLRAHPNVAWISYSGQDGTFTGAFRSFHGNVCTSQSRIIDGKTHVIEYQISDGSPPPFQKKILRESEDSGYDPRTRPFYTNAANCTDVVWSSPYIFYDRGIPGISCSLAVHDGERLCGVLSVDYDLNRLSAYAREAVNTPHSQIMMFTPDLVLLAHSDWPVVAATPSLDSRELGDLVTLKNATDPVVHAFFSGLERSKLPSVDEDSRIIRFSKKGGGSGPYVGCIVSMDLESGPMEYVATMAPVSDFAPSPWEFSRVPIFIALASLLVGGAAALQLARQISAPLTSLVHASIRIGTGDLDAPFDLGKLHEFKLLTLALRAMLRNLRDWMRVRSSLDLAMEIQRRLLPNKPPNIPGFDIAGYCAYCDETGGDYYDYIVIDRPHPRRFIVAIGDVMGHGLASALLMASARGILRSSIATVSAPGAILTHLNSLLFQDTGGNRFMTMCLASFDMLGSGCTWASAGHLPPIIFDAIDRVFQDPLGGDIPLGVIQNTEYGNYHFGPIPIHQIVFMGSDGVWEMFSESDEKFGKERLKQVIAASADGSADEIKNAILEALKQFRGSAPINDDVTFVIIKVQDTRQALPPPPPLEGV